MPGEGQVSVTIPTYVWEKIVRFFEENREDLRRKGIKSPTKLLILWLEEKVYSEQSP
jgi:hypothetical protein